MCFKFRELFRTISISWRSKVLKVILMMQNETTEPPSYKIDNNAVGKTEEK